jgi:acetyl esterase/lipase
MPISARSLRFRAVISLAVGACLACCQGSVLADEPLVLNLWPAEPPDETAKLSPEGDRTKPTDRLIAGRRVARIGDVSVPQLAVYKPPQAIDTGAVVVICPGGGHHILAYDLEGTEVAEWLNSIGVTGIVLKYRVPFRDPERRYRAALQDAQRAVRLVRGNANEWKLDPRRIGICGFSAGGETAALASLMANEQHYPAVDEFDKLSSRPDFTILVYPAGMADADNRQLRDYIPVNAEAPPMFFVHAFDDPVSVQHSLLLAGKLSQVGGSAELHVFATGGHGYGLRPTDDAVTQWPIRAAQWLREQGTLAPRP